MLDDIFLRSELNSYSNPSALGRAPYPPRLAVVLSTELFDEASDEISNWPGYRPTRLHSLHGLAAQIGVADVYFKDESTRFGLGSFKALGGAYAVEKVLHQELQKAVGMKLSLQHVHDDEYRDLKKNITVATATDGNHGRSVAWGAKMFGCRCVIYIHAEVSDGRKLAMEQFGAKVVRVEGNYDNSVRQAAQDAKSNGWFIVSDTSYEGYRTLPRQVMAGYGVMVQEAMQQMADQTSTHVFVQGGCGGCAAAVCSYLWQEMERDRPTFVVVEPNLADCLLQSAIQGRSTAIPIKDETIMAGLSCGEVSALAWEILSSGTDHFMAISDELVAPAMRLLADGVDGDPAVVAGESAVAGLAALLVVASRPELRNELKIDRNSRILLFGTEGATDPLIYEQLVGRNVETVLS